MRVYLQSRLSCSAKQAWDEVQLSRLLREVAWPVIRFAAVSADDFPERWQTGMTVLCRSYLFGLIPLGVRTLHFELVDGERMRIQTRERDPLVRRWDHVIHVRPTSGDNADDEQAIYSDEIEIDAGFLTPLVWLFAQCFYRHRQRRWRRVAARLAARRTVTSAA
jgi:hypothetical protein